MLDKLVDISQAYQSSLPQLLATQNQADMAKQIKHTTKRAEAQADAQLGKCFPDYTPPEEVEEDMSTLLNGVFIGTKELESIIKADNEQSGNVITQPANGRWWKGLLATLLGALLILLALWLYQKWFPPGSDGAYSIIAVPFEPPAASINE